MFFEDVEMESVPSIVHVRVPSFSTNFTLKSSKDEPLGLDESLLHVLFLSTGMEPLSVIVSFTESVSSPLMTMSLEMLKSMSSSAVGREDAGVPIRARAANTVRATRLASAERCVELRRTVT